MRACNGAVSGEVTEQLHCELGAVVEPRLAAAALRAHLGPSRAPGRYRFHPGRRVTGRRTVVDAAGTRWKGDFVVLATGAAYDHLAAAAPLGSRLRRVRLQLFVTDPFRGQLTTSVADADS